MTALLGAGRGSSGGLAEADGAESPSADRRAAAWGQQRVVMQVNSQKLVAGTQAASMASTLRRKHHHRRHRHRTGHRAAENQPAAKPDEPKRQTLYGKLEKGGRRAAPQKLVLCPSGLPHGGKQRTRGTHRAQQGRVTSRPLE